MTNLHPANQDYYFPSWFYAYKRVIKITLLSICVITMLVAFFVWNNWQMPLVSPITSLTTFHFTADDAFLGKKKRVVYGFLPYWNISKVAIQPELTQLSYFGLIIAPDGNIITREQEYAEPGYNNLQSEKLLELMNDTRDHSGTVEITLIQFNPQQTSTFLLSDQAHQNLFESLDSLLLAYPISGINIDIEIISSDKVLRDRLSLFVKRLRTHLDAKYDKIDISISLFASASNNKQIWDLVALNESVDYFVIMAYDFHRTSSILAGPVAPLFGGQEVWNNDITTHVKEFLTVIPPEKILLGLPFYGYEWKTTSRDAQSHTFPDTGVTASIARVQELLKRKDELAVQEQWNEHALSPYLSYEKDGDIHVIYYEDSRSISYKLDLVNQLDLAGIAIWAIGYEGQSRELWDVVRTKLRPDLE